MLSFLPSAGIECRALMMDRDSLASVASGPGADSEPVRRGGATLSGDVASDDATRVQHQAAMPDSLQRLPTRTHTVRDGREDP